MSKRAGTRHALSSAIGPGTNPRRRSQQIFRICSIAFDSLLAGVVAGALQQPVGRRIPPEALAHSVRSSARHRETDCLALSVVNWLRRFPRILANLFDIHALSMEFNRTAQENGGRRDRFLQGHSPRPFDAEPPAQFQP